jgi:hypothetical protein
MDTAPIELDVTLDALDMAALTRQVRRKSKGRLVFLILILVSLLAGFMAARMIYPHTNFLPLLVALDISLVILLVLILSFRGLIFRKAYGDNSYFFVPRHYAIDARGVTVDTNYTNGFFAWQGLSGIEKSKAHIYIMLPGNTQAHVIPFHAIPAAWNPDNFVKQLEAWRAQAMPDTAKAA